MAEETRRRRPAPSASEANAGDGERFLQSHRLNNAVPLHFRGTLPRDLSHSHSETQLQSGLKVDWNSCVQGERRPASSGDDHMLFWFVGLLEVKCFPPPPIPC